MLFETIRLADFDVPVGVQPDMTKEGDPKDDWRELYEKIITADILLRYIPELPRAMAEGGFFKIRKRANKKKKAAESDL